MAIVTSASAQNCVELVDAFGLLNFFELIISAKDVTRPKPSPEGFLKAMRYFDVAPKDTLIFEDSAAGIDAAKRAGALCLAVTGA